MDIRFLFNTYSIPSKPYPNLSQAWTILGVYLLLHLMVLSVSLLLPAVVGTGRYWQAFISYVVVFSGVLGFVALMMRTRGQKITLQKNKVSPVVFILLFFIMPLTAILFEPITEFVDLIPFPGSIKEYLDQVKKAMKEATNTSLPSFLSIVIAAPLFEEIICRGVILEGLLRNRMNPKKAVLWSAIIFTCFHLNPYQIIYPMVMGCFFGWVYYKTRSIWICIFMHFINNGFAFFALTVNSQELQLNDILRSDHLLIYMITAIPASVLIWLLISYFNDRETLLPE